VAAAQRLYDGVGMSDGGDTIPALVTAAWLRKQIGRPDLVLLDARITREVRPGGGKHYAAAPDHFRDAGHIPGAVFADLVNELSDPTTGLNFTLPDTAVLRDGFRALGVSTHSTVIAYDDDSGVWAARIWWLLRAAGHQHVAVLNGGLKAWLHGGGDLAYGPALAPERGDFDPIDPQPAFISLYDVEQLACSDAAGTLLCALDQEVFSGERPSGAARDGHIPGSQSFPYSALLDQDGLIDTERVRPALAGARLVAGEPLASYCGGGITACGVALALVAAGFPQVRIYDGSLQEWAADERRPVQVGR